MNAYRYNVSLRIWHPSLDPAEITSVLNLIPYRAWRVGEARKTPVGDSLEGTYRDTYWTSGSLSKGEWPGTDLSSALSTLLDRMVSHRDFFDAIRSAGGKVEFFVGWYFAGNSGDVFDCSVLARMADLKIDLSLDVYPPSQPQNNF